MGGDQDHTSLLKPGRGKTREQGERLSDGVQDRSDKSYARTGQAEEPLTASPIQAAATSSVTGRPLEQPSGDLLWRRQLELRLRCKHCGGSSRSSRDGRSKHGGRRQRGVGSRRQGSRGGGTTSTLSGVVVHRWRGMRAQERRASSCCVFRLVV
eukprot:2010785-Pleurochrysis_carterae.AAC.6